MNGWLTDAVLREYTAGVTHIRIYPPSGGRFPLVSQEQFALWLRASRGIIEAGMTVFLGCLDVVDERFMARDEVPDYIHVIVTDGADYGAPATMMDGTLRVDPDKPRLHQWHMYELDAGNLDAVRHWQERIQHWADANRTVTYCGKWGIGPPDKSNGAASDYRRFPGHTRQAAQGWGSSTRRNGRSPKGRWWRLKEAGSARLRPEIGAAISEAFSHIAGQPWYKDQNG